MNAKSIALVLLFHSTSQVATAAELRRDPFQAPTEFSTVAANARAQGSSSQVIEMRITGILIADGTALVSIGGKVLAVGDEFNNHVLLRATEDQAVFLRGDEIVTMQLYSEKDDETNSL